MLPPNSILIVVFTVVISFIIVFLLTPSVIRKLGVRGLVEVDIHKAGRPSIPSIGGLVMVPGYIGGILILLPMFSQYSHELTAVLSTVLMISLLGMVDDVLRLRQSIKALIPALASLPLLMVVSSDRVFLLPLIGFVKVGLIYPLLLVPIGVMAAANLTNMLAGFNGLEAGMGLIAISCLTISEYIVSDVKGVIVLAPMIGSLLAFLIYNRYPARIFPGNSGTYAIGAVIAAGVILGDMEVVGMICLTPYIAEFVVKAMGGFKGSCLGNRNHDNTLSPPKSGPESLTHFVMGRGRFTESQLVRLFLLIEMVFGIIAIIIAYSSLYFMLFPA